MYMEGRPIKIARCTSAQLYAIPLLEEIERLYPWVWVDARDADVILIDAWTKLTPGEYNPKAVVVGISGESWINGCLDRDYELGSHLPSQTQGDKTWFPYIPQLGNRYLSAPICHVDDVWGRKDVCWICSSYIHPWRINFVKDLIRALGTHGIEVACHGDVLNNAPKPEGSWDATPEVYRNYKFTIAIENQLRDGYITEKIPMALAGRSIPVILKPKKYSLYPFPDTDDWCLKGEGIQDASILAAKINHLLHDERAYRKMADNNPLLHRELYDNFKEIKRGLFMLAKRIIERVKK